MLIGKDKDFMFPKINYLNEVLAMRELRTKKELRGIKRILKNAEKRIIYNSFMTNSCQVFDRHLHFTDGIRILRIPTAMESGEYAVTVEKGGLHFIPLEGQHLPMMNKIISNDALKADYIEKPLFSVPAVTYRISGNTIDYKYLIDIDIDSSYKVGVFASNNDDARVFVDKPVYIKDGEIVWVLMPLRNI